MQVFNAYFKIVNKHKGGFLIYFIIFLLVSVVITSSLSGVNAQAFSQTKSYMAFYSAENTPLTQGLKDFLGKNAVLVDIPDTQQDIQDALFYNQITYVLRVPKGFTDSFMSGSGQVALQKQVYPAQSHELYTDMMVNRYLNTLKLYLENVPNTTFEAAAQNTAKNLEAQAAVTMANTAGQQDTNYISYYFQYLCFAIMAILIMGVTTVMMTFNEADLQNRNTVSPMRSTNMSMQLFTGTLAFGVVIWALLCGISFALFGKINLNLGTLLLCLNALCLSVVSMSIGFVAGMLIRNTGAQSAIINVVSLGLSFISGVFVPQALLGKQILDIASFTPTYWYVKAVEELRSMTVFSAQNVTPVVYDMLIQLGFAAAILIVTLALTKQRKMASAYN